VAFDIFLKLVSGDGVIAGESTSEKHKSEIDVQSFSWGESHDGGTADAQEVAFVTPMSIASPQIAKACAEGTQIVSAQISVNNASLKGASELLMIKLAGVIVGSYQLGIAESDPQLTDRFTLAFAHMDVTKTLQRPDGSLGAASQASLDFPPPAS
jgi:type VI secretion system secreted protein Hcp